MADLDVIDFLPAARRSAVHLESRDAYTPDSPRFLQWQHGQAPAPEDRGAWWVDWHQAVAGAVARGVAVQRVRVVSEPLSEYVRFEHDVTYRNLAAGEEVRWLPRRRAIDLAIPSHDCWLVDDEILLVHHFAGNGDYLGTERLDEASAVRTYRDGIAQLWQRAIPHSEYRPGPDGSSEPKRRST